MNEKKNDSLKDNPRLNILPLAFEMGYSIAIPLILFALGGRLLDKYLDSSPLFLLFGVVISIFVTTWIIWKKISKIL